MKRRDENKKREIKVTIQQNLVFSVENVWFCGGPDFRSRPPTFLHLFCLLKIYCWLLSKENIQTFTQTTLKLLCNSLARVAWGHFDVGDSSSVWLRWGSSWPGSSERKWKFMEALLGIVFVAPTFYLFSQKNNKYFWELWI